MARRAGDIFAVAAKAVSVIVMLKGIPNLQLTTQVTQERKLLLKDLRYLSCFRPVLALKYPEGPPSKDFYVIVKSEIVRSGVSVWTNYLPQSGRGNINNFSPSQGLLDLSKLPRQGLMGEWKLNCGVLILSAQNFNQIPQLQLRQQLQQRNFFHLITHQWEIVEEVSVNLNAEGRLEDRMSFEERERQQERRVSVTDL